MSRYTLIAHDPRYAVIVGWDSPLETFFCQAFDTILGADEERFCVLWEGTALREMMTVEALQTRLGPFATIPKAIGARLHNDQTQTAPRSPLQDTMLQLLQTGV